VLWQAGFRGSGQLFAFGFLPLKNQLKEKNKSNVLPAGWLQKL
jgi:hypothetical protein